jgi:hypothetical protein
MKRLDDGSSGVTMANKILNIVVLRIRGRREKGEHNKQEVKRRGEEDGGEVVEDAGVAPTSKIFGFRAY